MQVGTGAASDVLIFGLVLALRLLIPLAIPRYPLPAILAAFLLDGIDQTIFQRFTTLDLGFYQGYDKALDVYYLTLAYLSTLRNWTHRSAFAVDRFLLYYRLVGVLLFELTQVRAVLLIFPNTFEYFFDFYEGVRLRWNPLRMSRRLVLGAAAFIWIVIKLPQEYIIHVAQVDTTDWIKTTIFGVAATATWGAAAANRPLVTLALVVVLVVLVAGARWLIRYRLPPADHRPRLAADAIPAAVAERSERIMRTPGPLRLTDPALLEKVALVSLVSVVFAQILPGVEADVLAVTLGVALVIAANTALSAWLARRGRTPEATLRQFLALAGINTLLLLLYAALLPAANGSLNLGHALFFALLLTLLVTLFDRYHPIHRARFEADG
jgi:hypothetical protein